MKKVYDDDDGRVIASMEHVERDNLIFPRSLPEESKDIHRQESNEEYSKEERRWMIQGTLHAALVIAIIFAAVFALFILLLNLVSKIN